MKPDSGSRFEGLARALLCALVFSLPFEKAFEFPGLGTIARVLGLGGFRGWPGGGGAARPSAGSQCRAGAGRRLRRRGAA